MGISTYVNWYCKLQACFFSEFESTFDPPRVGLNDGAAGRANDSAGARKCQVCHRWDLSVTAYGW